MNKNGKINHSPLQCILIFFLAFLFLLSIDYVALIIQQKCSQMAKSKNEFTKEGPLYEFQTEEVQSLLPFVDFPT